MLTCENCGGTIVKTGRRRVRCLLCGHRQRVPMATWRKLLPSHHAQPGHYFLDDCNLAIHHDGWRAWHGALFVAALLLISSAGLLIFLGDPWFAVLVRFVGLGLCGAVLFTLLIGLVYRYSVKISIPGHCPNCYYPQLEGATRCPECGSALPESTEKHLGSLRTQRADHDERDQCLKAGRQ